MRPRCLLSGIVIVFVAWVCYASDVDLPYGSSCPVIHTNDGNIDVYTLEYAMALASAGDIRLVGIVADAGTGYRAKPKAAPKVWEGGRRMYADIVGKARRSGMVNIPDPVAGANWALDRPASGRIEDTVPLDTPGSRLIAQEARKATPEEPLVVVTGGALTCVADAYLLDNSIADRLVVAALLGRTTDMRCYNTKVDAWAAYIVLQRLRYVQFPANKDDPRVPKARLRGSEIPDGELKRFMVDKDQAGVDLPGERDADVQPIISIMRPDYVRAAKSVSAGGWIDVGAWGNGYPKLPVFRDDPTSRALVITEADRSIATDEWWRALSNPEAYQGMHVQQAPYGEKPHAIPGTIEAEHFDWGGKGVAFHNAVPTGWPRSRVDASSGNAERCEDEGGGYNLAHLASGDWYEYTVDVAQSDHYTVEARAVSEAGGVFHIEIDGQDVTGLIAVPETGGDQIWRTVAVPDIELAAGEHVIRIVIDGDGLKINYLRFLHNA